MGTDDAVQHVVGFGVRIQCRVHSVEQYSAGRMVADGDPLMVRTDADAVGNGEAATDQGALLSGFAPFAQFNIVSGYGMQVVVAAKDPVASDS